MINDVILKKVEEKEREFKENFPLITEIQHRSYEYTFRTGKIPTEIKMNIKVYQELVNAVSFGEVGSIIPKTFLGMEIVIDDRLENIEIIGYDDFMGMKMLIK